jgi:hypothetical protein
MLSPESVPAIKPGSSPGPVSQGVVSYNVTVELTLTPPGMPGPIVSPVECHRFEWKPACGNVPVRFLRYAPPAASTRCHRNAFAGGAFGMPGSITFFRRASSRQRSEAPQPPARGAILTERRHWTRTVSIIHSAKSVYSHGPNGLGRQGRDTMSS